jgi:hypothetical protein
VTIPNLSPHGAVTRGSTTVPFSAMRSKYPDSSASELASPESEIWTPEAGRAGTPLGVSAPMSV